MKQFTETITTAVTKKLFALGLMFFLSLGLAFAQETNCTDGIDNDGDNLIDCQDGDCPSCTTAIQCIDPYVYYMPPIMGDKANLTLFGLETFQISTLARAATVVIKNPFTGAVIQTVNVPVANPALINVLPTAGGIIATNQVMIPKGTATNINTVLSGSGLIFSSDQPLQITYSSKSVSSIFNQDILQLQGKASLGKSFYAASQTELDNNNTDNEEAHFVSVMATEPGTTSIQFKIPINAATGVLLKLKGVAALTSTITINLTKGQTYMLASERTGRQGTVTGLLVTSDKNIVVNSGDQHVPTSEGGDSDSGLMQLIPIAALETQYIAIDGGNNDDDGAGAVHDVVTIIATENGTTFTVNGVAGGVDGDGRAVPITLNAGQYFSYYLANTNTAPNNQPYYIQLSKRAYVYHVTSKGSSEMGMDILPPINNCIGSKQIDFEKTGNTADAIIILPTSGLSSLKFRNLPYTTYAALVDPDGAGALPAAQANSISTSGYSYVVIRNANILASNNRVTSNEKFHCGIFSESGGTGNYAYISNYEKSIEILDPATGFPVSAYIVGEVAPGTPLTHCINIVGCGTVNAVTNATASGYAGAGTQGAVTFSNNCITYTMQAGAPPCAKETVTVLVSNEFGITSTVCLSFENSTKPFTITISPTNPFICSTGSPNNVDLVATVVDGTGTPTFSWQDPLGATFAGTTGGAAPNFTTTLNATLAGTYKLTVTNGTCSKTVDIEVTSRNCNDNDSDGVSDATDIDDDNDGILDTAEIGDTDGDGVPNSLDLDSDNDGIPDVIEAGGVDVDGNGIIDNFTDTDGDGLSQNVDGVGSLGLGTPDFDGDGIPNFLDLDADNDGIPDIIEVGGIDFNNDGLVDTSNFGSNGYSNIYDPADFGTPLISTGTDTNNDGRPNSYTEDNADGSVSPNFLDLDADNDGILDVIEAGLGAFDTDSNGVVDGASTNGWNNAINALPTLVLPNTDTNGSPNYLDIDVDNDGIPDNIEAQATVGYIAPTGLDTDNDGIDNAYDNVDTAGTFGGNANNGLVPVNTDGTDNPDYTDLDTDNDGRPDANEGFDTNGNGIIDGTEIVAGTSDNDNDGLLNGYDVIVGIATANNVTNNTSPTSYPNAQGGTPERDWRDLPDNDRDGIADINDLDDDNDGILDTTENGGINPFGDSDSDGIANYLDVTSCGTALVNGVCPSFDKDGDGIINQFDLDADNDGIPDVVEAGGTDANGDGIVDNLGTIATTGPNAGIPAPIASFPYSTSGINFDFDGDGIPNYLDLDADNDGIPDIIEAGGIDANNNGIVDVLTDLDRDGFADAVDGNVNGTLNTTIPLILTGADTNNDGRPDTYPNDNADGSPRPNFLDLDADNDGILDATEAGIANTNGVATGTLGNDGWSDTVDALATLTLPNTDTNGLPNYLDIDADNDGIPDNIEGQTTAGYIVPTGTDTDGDGIDNAYDTVVGFGGVGITPTNTDGTDNPDYTDLDTDNDGRPDAIEGWDTNGNGVIDGTEVVALATDTDGDGLLNGYDTVAGVGTAGNVNNGLATTVLLAYPNVQPGSVAQPDWRDPRDNDGDGVADSIDLDDDNDGILDTTENGGINPFADSDGDGLPNYLDVTSCGTALVNGVCPTFDKDGDGIMNQFDLDADNDGIPDVVEAGGTDANGDGIVDNLGVITTTGPNAGIPAPIASFPYSTSGINFDFDGDGIPNFLDLDADGDGIPDIIEVGGVDANNNGMVDVLTDIDRDGFADAVDGIVTSGTNGVPLILTSVDGNNDGRPDTYPNDNADGSPRPNFLDLDADNDGILDATEAGIANTNGVATGTLGNDGWSDTVDALATLTLPNTDTNGLPNYLDIDADNDGIPDNIEGQTTAGYIVPTGNDTDGDGIDNAYDTVVGFGGIGITPTNTDGTDNPDYTDLDTDNDGRPDAIEGWDTNGNGVIDGTEVVALATDTDGDGLLNGYDTVVVVATANNVNNNTSPTSYPNVQNTVTPERDWRDLPDNDRDGVADNIDLDDDNDGILDTTENGGLDPFADSDSDGIPNYLDVTSCGTALVNGVCPSFDKDGDGIINQFDLDADNDGIPDVVEAGGTDANGDGIVDNLGTVATTGATAGIPVPTVANPYPTTGINFDFDNDGIPNFLDLDADGDGIPDIIEAGGIDANNNGLVDTFVDIDKDGFADAVDGNVNGTINTTIPLILTGADTNGNGAPDTYPNDNADGSPRPNFLDLDSDNDGILDATEAGIVNTNGIATGTLGNDGWSDTVDALATLTLPNTDTNGLPNYLDIDADNDGIPDNIEGQTTAGYVVPTGTDTDGDGIDNAYDTVMGNGGVGITPTNTDGTDNPDYTDLDTDNDGRSDAIEGWDTNGNGIIDGTEVVVLTTDTDGDGLLNGYDATNGTVAGNGVPSNVNNGLATTVLLGYPNIQQGSATQPDWRDPSIGIGVAKSASIAVQPNGTFNVTFTIIVKNLGGQALNNVQVVDNLATTFPAPASFGVVSNTVVGATVNAGYTGTGANTGLFAAAQSLAVGASATITLVVNVTKGATTTTTSFNNVATGSGTGALSGVNINDASNNGLNTTLTTGTPTQIGLIIDPNSNGNASEAGENVPTPITFPVIGVVKQAGAPVQLANGTINIPFTIVVRNTGTEALNNVQVVENLTTTFGTAIFSVLATPVPTATGATISPTFTGTGTNTNLLATAQTLAVGASATITFTVNLTPRSPAVAYSNSVTANGTGATSGVNTTDNSNNGGITSMDTDNDGINNEIIGLGGVGDNTPTPINLPVIGVAKSLGTISSNPDGSFDIPFTVIVRNLGTETLTNVTVTDNLVATFPAPATFTILAAPSSLQLTPNGFFNGTTVTNLVVLTPIQTLAAGASATITFTVNVFTNTATPPVFNNTAVGNGTGLLSGGTTTDSSNNGGAAAIDPNNNGNPRNPTEDTPTTISIPRIGIAKAAGTPVLQVNGSSNVTFTVVVRNFGNETLNNVQVVDDLILAFPTPATPSLVGAVTAVGATANTTYTGITPTPASRKQLLATGQTLPIGGTITITFTVNILTNGSVGPFNNVATGTGTGAISGNTTTDDSNNGANPDLDNDGNPDETTDNVPTPINLSNAIIGVAKAAGTPVINANGTIDVPFTIVVKNLGNEALNNVQVVDNLNLTFPLPATYTILTAPTSATLTVDAGFNGNTNTNLLAATQSLAIGASATITFTVQLTTNGIPTAFSNSAVASGIGATSTATTTDTSNNGSNTILTTGTPTQIGTVIDPDGNSNPGNAGENTPTPISFPRIGLAKEAGVPAIQANGTYNIPFTITLSNLGTEILNNVQVVENLATTFPAPVTFTIVPATLLGTGITANTGFTGIGVNDLVAATQSLAIGATATVTFTVNVNLNGFTGALSNSVTGTGTGAISGVPTTDVSDNGLNPDNGGGTSTGNGNPKDPNEDDATPIGFPKIGVAKAAGAPVQQTDGTFNIPFTIIVKNLGNEALNNTQVTENLTTTFGTTPFSVLATPAPTAIGATISPTFTGTGVNTNLLAATQTLAVGASITITFTVNLAPASPAISYSNTVTASGTGATSSVVSVDTSNNGGDTAIDSNTDGNPNEPVDNTPTPVNLPVIGIAKAAGTPVINADGTINIPFTIVVQNLGSEALNGVQVVDNLNLTFPLPATYTISTAPTSATLTANAGFNGNTDTNLLSATQTLAVGASATITFTVQLTTNGTPTAFSNSAVANGTGATSTGTTTDTSNNGGATVIDPNNDGNPGNAGENMPTPITFPRIGLAKAVGTPVLQGNGSFNVPFTIVVTNYGNEAINNVQVTDDLSASFPAPAVPSVLAGAVSVTGGTPNATYTGTGSAAANFLLAGTDNLAIGATMTITFTVNVVTNGLSSFTNSAVATGTGATSTVPITDTSNSGTNADPDNDGNPNEPTENVPTPISIGTPIIGLAKSVGTLVQQTNGSFNVPFVITVKNLGTEILNSVQVVENLALTFPAPATFTLVGTPVATGGLTLAAGYTGTGANINLLGVGNTLAVGATETITIVVNVNPRGATTAFTNTAVGTATGANSNLPTTDDSNNGGATEIDTDGDNEPNEPADNVPTPINLPIIGVAKNLVTSTLQANGTYRLDFAVIVKNMGTETLNNVQLIENLSLAFPAPLTFALSGVPVATGAGLATNATFTGTGANTNLLAGTSTLAPGVQGTVTFSVIVTLNTAITFNFTNTVVGSGTGATSGVVTTNNSATGTNVDTNGNGLPDQPAPTPISLPRPNPVIGVSKLAGTPTIQPQGGFNVTYTIKVKNIGNVPLSNVSVKENLDVTFGDIDRVAGYEVLSNTVAVVAPNVMVANAAFNGKGNATNADINLLTATGNTLAIGAEATITLTVYVRGFGQFSNQVVAQGTGSAGGSSIDTSGDDTNVDANGNGITNEPAENQPTVINVNPIPVATDIFIPDGFSPNSDGRNDTFVIDGLNGRGADVKIYNRWGNLVFENGDYKNDWVGTANVGLQVGTELPDATYFYIVKLTDGQKFAKYVIIKR